MLQPSIDACTAVRTFHTTLRDHMTLTFDLAAPKERQQFTCYKKNLF